MPSFAKTALDSRLDTSSCVSTGFVVPSSMSLVNTAQKRIFVSEISSIVANFSRKDAVGCPDALRPLLKNDFKCYEEPDHFECYRERILWEISYPKLPSPLDDRLLELMFHGKCTRELSSILQLRYYDKQKSQVICRTQ
jgi:hypothetical protein